MGKTRVLVAEDSLTVRHRLCEVIESDPELELVGSVEDGKQAIKLCQELRPDVVTMDMMMPVISGLAATEFIMAHCPTPILIVSSSTNRGELFKTYDALAAGALDVLEKPRGDEPDGVWERKFLSTLKLVSRIRVITHLRARFANLGRPPTPTTTPITRLSPLQRYSLLVIGASTGGPNAIIEILRGLPPKFPLPILFVLHINEPFGTAFADWLDAQTKHRVVYAKDGEPIAPGHVVMAPPGRHLMVRGGRLRLTQDAERHSCRPSVDVLFESVAREYGSTAIACLLSGMGRDGASGLLEIRKAGGMTIAQNEASCVVYGMPREAVLLNAVDRLLPVSEIASALSSLVSFEGKP